MRAYNILHFKTSSSLGRKEAYRKVMVYEARCQNILSQRVTWSEFTSCNLEVILWIQWQEQIKEAKLDNIIFFQSRSGEEFELFSITSANEGKPDSFKGSSIQDRIEI